MENKDERIKQLEKENKELHQYVNEVNIFVDQLHVLVNEKESEISAGGDVLEYAIRIVEKYHKLKRYIGWK